MKNVILRLLVSGVAIAGVAVAVILIFFQKNPLELSYAALVEVMKDGGAQSIMERTVTDEQGDFASVCGKNYRVLMDGEFNLLKNTYEKIPLIESDKDYSGLLEATNNYVEALENTNHKIEVFTKYKNKLIKQYKEATGGAAPSSEKDYADVAYNGFKNEVMVLVEEQINSAALLNDKLLKCIQENIYGETYNYELAMDKVVNAYCKLSLKDLNNAEVTNKLAKLVEKNAPAVKQAVVASNSEAPVEFVNAISRIDIDALITDAEYKNGLDEEAKAYATVVETYIATLCA